VCSSDLDDNPSISTLISHLSLLTYSLRPKLTVVLDIDETLIHRHNNGLLTKRPHLDQFIEYVYKNFDVWFFTSSDRTYALEVLGDIVPNNSPTPLLKHRKHCDLPNYSKDLRKLGTDLNRTILVDDKNVCPEGQGFSVVVEKYIDATNDNVLLTLMNETLPAIDRAFTVKEWIERQGSRPPTIWNRKRFTM
jgi:TFIIF-interacting CTD phosphatase-like protein